MTKEQYRNRLSEIYNQIGELASERTSMIADRMTLISDELEKLGIKYGHEYTLLTQDTERICTFNGVHCNSQYLVYLEFTFDTGDRYMHAEPVDINHDITIRLPDGGEIDYWTFMHQFI